MATLLAGVLTPLLAGQAVAQPPRGGTPPARRGEASAEHRAVARSKLLQARAQLGQGNFDNAEALANDVARLQLAYDFKDDSPAKVIKDVQAARSDPKALLQAARASLARKEFDRAESYARAADKLASMWTFPIWGDTPAKVLREAEAGRKVAGVPARPAVAKAPTPPAAKTGPTPAVKSAPIQQASHTQPAPAKAKTNDADTARALLKQGRQALAANKVAEAKKLSGQARATKASLGWWDDNPDRLDADIRRAEQRLASKTAPAAKGPAPAVAKGGSTIPRDKDEAKKLLALGRQQLNAAKFDEAARTAQRIKAQTNVSWGMFEDTPDRLQIDIERARVKRDREESVKVLAEGRRLYQKGDYTGAERLAFRAQKLHGGSYSIWDLGDRPSKLIADAQAAQAKSRRAALPPTAVARNNTPPAKAAPAVTPPARAVEPKTTIDRNAVARTTVPPPAPPAPPPAVVQGPAPNKLRAQQLVAEAQRLHAAGKLIDARQKAVEAQRQGATFAADEMSPEGVYQAIAIDVRQRVEMLTRQADDDVTHGKGAAVARHRLTEARQLAASFGHDVRPIDAKLASLSQGAVPAAGVAQATHTTPALPPVPHYEPARPSHGQQLLDNARAELRKGETANARRMAEEALKGNHGVRDEAMAVLRTVDAEEENQKRLEARRAFNAALSAYNRNEYAQAGAILAAIDHRHLQPDQLARLREIAATPGMGRAPERVADKGAIVRTGGTAPAVAGPDTGRARASDAAPPDALDRHKQRQLVLMSKLRQDGLTAQSEAANRLRAGQHDEAILLLQDHLNTLADEKLEAAQLAVLKRPVEARLSQYKLLKSQKDLAAGVLARGSAANERVKASQRAEQLKHQNVEKLMRDFTGLYKEGKYAEAETVALRASDLDPDNGVVTAAVHMARRQMNVMEYKGLKADKEKFFIASMNDAERLGSAGAIRSGIEYEKERWDRASKRGPLTPIKLQRLGEREKAIERKLSTPVTLNFESATLQQVIRDLRDIHGLNIVEDRPALQERGISLDSPVSIALDQVSLKSALNILLHQVGLTYVIRDEVLMITTEENAKGKFQVVAHQVADLVIPVENFGDVRSNNFQPIGGTTTNVAPPSPAVGPSALVGGTPVGSPTGSMLNGPGGSSTTKKNATNTTEEQLIKLITNTINPRSWNELGGQGSIEYNPLTFSLVINQTPDIQEQVQDLLAALRRLIDQEVAVEVRLITVSEDFFERIGVNFNLNILTDKANTRFEPALLNNSFVVDSTRFINAFDPKRFLAGITPANTLTPTLDIPITQNSFFQTVPTFGNYTAAGLATGIAFLSDIQVFLFMEAVQGDQRANVMQAPKLTMFNGQTASLQVFDQQPFVSGVIVQQVGGGQFALIPQIQPNFSGISLTVQPVISHDRRFVRMSIQPQLTNLVPGPVNTFPIVVPIFTSIEGNQSGQPVVFTQFIQQPVQTNVTVQTTVVVPDGGTVLMGGLKRLSEARSEYGTPILSKIPYVNRLFKNVGYGRETDSLLLMVTPRIIVQEEEEERQAGFSARRETGGSF